MYLTKDEASRKLRAQMSYRTALRGQRRSGRLARIPWFTWIITVGHLRFLMIYLVIGVISVISSFYFAPQEVSVGASGAIVGVVGAYSVFVLIQRRAFRAGGITILLYLVLVIRLNLSIGLFLSN